MRKFNLTYPILTRGEKRTAIRRPHVEPSRHCNVKWRHGVTCMSHLSVFRIFMFCSNIKWGIKQLARNIIHCLWCEDWIRKSTPRDQRLSLLASIVMPTSDPRDGVFFPTLTLRMDFYYLAYPAPTLGKFKNRKAASRTTSDVIEMSKWCHCVMSHLRMDFLLMIDSYIHSFTSLYA